MSKVQHASQTPPSVDPLLVTPTKQRIVKRKLRKVLGWRNVKKHGAKDGKNREASSKRNHDCCKCGKVWTNPENNTCKDCWQEGKLDTPPKKKRKAQTLTEQTLNDEEKAILVKLRDPKTIGRYELVYKPTQKRTIGQCYNKVAEMEQDQWRDGHSRPWAWQLMVARSGRMLLLQQVEEGPP